MTFWVAVNTLSVEVVETALFKAGFDTMSITGGVLLYDIIYHPIDYCDWPRTGVKANGFRIIHTTHTCN